MTCLAATLCLVGAIAVDGDTLRVPVSRWPQAVRTAMEFADKYPDRESGNWVGYRYSDGFQMSVHWTDARNISVIGDAAEREDTQ